MSSHMIKNRIINANNKMGGSSFNASKSEMDDHTYIDIQIKYNPDKDIGQNSSYAIYNSTKTEPIINNPSEYHLVIDRFNISGFLLPTYIYLPSEPGTVSLSYLGNIYNANLIFDSRTTITETNDPSYYHIYEYQHYVDMINEAFKQAFSQIPIPPIGSSAPYMTWDTDSQKFTLHAEKAFYDETLAQPIGVYFNDTLYRVFPFFPYFEQTAIFWQFVIRDYRNNTEVIGGNDYLFLKQEAVGISYFNPVKGLVFTSQNIPVKNTYTQINNNVQFQNDSNASSMGILIDFKIDIINSLDQRKQLLYVPQQNYRRLDLYGTLPLRSIDIQIYWTDLFGNINPLRIPKSQDANIKLLFIRKQYIND